MRSGFAQVQQFLRETSGANIDDSKRYLLEATLKPLLEAQSVANIDELARNLQEHRRSELARLVMEAMTINETSFFRERHLFAALTTKLIPKLVRARPRAQSLRIWCAGCASGQEPYSIAMTIAEQGVGIGVDRIEIVATDLSSAMIEKAKAGRYSQFEVQRGLPIGLLLRYFQQLGVNWQVNEAIRGKVRFAPQNLLEVPADFGTFDVVLCRNVLFYFDDATRRKVVTSLARHTAGQGFLIVGASERLGSANQDLFTPLADESYIYERRASP